MWRTEKFGKNLVNFATSRRVTTFGWCLDSIQSKTGGDTSVKSRESWLVRPLSHNSRPWSGVTHRSWDVSRVQEEILSRSNHMGWAHLVVITPNYWEPTPVHPLDMSTHTHKTEIRFSATRPMKTLKSSTSSRILLMQWDSSPVSMHKQRGARLRRWWWDLVPKSWRTSTIVHPSARKRESCDKTHWRDASRKRSFTGQSFGFSAWVVAWTKHPQVLRNMNAHINT